MNFYNEYGPYFMPFIAMGIATAFMFVVMLTFVEEDNARCIEIGEIIKEKTFYRVGTCFVDNNGKPIPLDKYGFDHEK